jgi:guanosine-3',5'-bis(diphosphate) 3'-pyrophosphohydrolase
MVKSAGRVAKSFEKPGWPTIARMGSDLVAVARALDFAARKHSGQRRKGEAGEPYVNHLAEVARLVAEATDGSDTVAVLAALLHDAIEDTPTTREELEREFGREVADIVVEVTDDKSLPKTERKRLQVETAPDKSRRAKLIKIADKTSNLRSIAKSPPVGWDLKRQREYFEWAARVVAGCRGTNAALERWFDEAHTAGLAALDQRG